MVYHAERSYRINRLRQHLTIGGVMLALVYGAAFLLLLCLQDRDIARATLIGVAIAITPFILF